MFRPTVGVLADETDRRGQRTTPVQVAHVLHSRLRVDPTLGRQVDAGEQVRERRPVGRNGKMAVVPFIPIGIDDGLPADIEHIGGRLLERHPQLARLVAGAPGVEAPSDHTEDELTILQPADIARPGDLRRQVEPFHPLEPRSTLRFLGRDHSGYRSHRGGPRKGIHRKYKTTTTFPEWLVRHGAP